MIEIHPAKEIRGTIKLPPDPDLYAMVLVACAATGRRAVISPLPNQPVRERWNQVFGPLLQFTGTETEIAVEPQPDPGSLIQLLNGDHPHGEFMLFTLLAMGKTIVIPPVKPLILQRWSELLKVTGCTLEISERDNGVALILTQDQQRVTRIPDCDGDSLELYLGLAFGMQGTLSAEVDFLYMSPVRNLLSLFGCEFVVRNVSADRAADPIARRIQRMRSKNKKDKASQQLFEINLGCAEPSEETLFISLPGDTLLCSLMVAAKAIHQRGSLVVEAALLETWALPTLQLVRKMGCTAGLQPQSQSTFGEQGLLQMQRFELTGRKTECLPLFIYRQHIAAIAVIALFSQGESVMRSLELLRGDIPDGIDQLSECLKTAGAHLGEMPDGIVVKGGKQNDGFDISSPLSAALAGAFCIAGLKCLGKTTVNSDELLMRWPDFSSLLDSICVYRADQS